MHNNLHKKKKSKVVKARSDNNEPDEKKTRLENVDESALSFPDTCKSFVKVNMNSLQNVDKTPLDNVEDLNKQGNICCLFIIYSLFIHSVVFCIMKAKQLKVSIPKGRYWIRIFC